MTKLEKALAHEGKPPCEAAAIHYRPVDDSFIIGHLCPRFYELTDTNDCDNTTCRDCWNEEVME